MEFPTPDEPSDQYQFTDRGTHPADASNFGPADYDGITADGPLNHDLPDTLPDEFDGEVADQFASRIPDTIEELSTETVLDMSEPEREATASALEAYAASGDRYETVEVDVSAEGERTTMVHSGYERPVPRGALRAEGVPYDNVIIATADPEDQVPYAVGIMADRVVPATIQVPVPGRPGETAAVDVEGEEDKTVILNIGSAEGHPRAPIEARTELWAPRSGSVALPKDTSEDEPAVISIPVTASMEGPLMTLDEVRAIVRAAARADEFPDPTTVEQVLEATVGSRDVSDAEIPAEGENYRDLPQAARGALMKEIDTYARGCAEPIREGPETRYERAIPDDILRANNVRGSASVQIIERPTDNFYRIGINTSEPAVVDVPHPTKAGEKIPMAARRESTLVMYTRVGEQRGTMFPDTFEDPTSPDGIQMDFAAHERVPQPGGDWYYDTPEITYDEVVRLYRSLQQANERAREVAQPQQPGDQ